MPNDMARLRHEIKEADLIELERLRQSYKQEHWSLRMQAATTALDNPKRIWFVRKAVARLETELHRRRGETAEGTAVPTGASS
jgi:ribosomal protein L29